jgi:FdhD protein
MSQEPDLPSPLVQLPARAADGQLLKLDWVAEEVPVALVYNGVSQAVMMATPADLEDFALGFSLTEGFVEHAGELLDLEEEISPDGISLQLSVTAACEARLKARRRTLAGRTGCGLCGVDSLQQVRRELPRRAAPPAVDLDAVRRAMAALRDAQPLNAQCGGLHAAAWCAADGRIVLVREDVGRHNALDKLAGAMARARVDAAAGFIAVSSRASFEMAQKAAAIGAPLLASVSAPTALAVRSAEAQGLALVSFVRGERATRYA